MIETIFGAVVGGYLMKKFPKQTTAAAKGVCKATAWVAAKGYEMIDKADRDSKQIGCGFSFCEVAGSRSRSEWHIRPLTRAGKQVKGGTDTSALCSTPVAWDLEFPISDRHLEHCCPGCRKAYENMMRIPTVIEGKLSK